MKNNAKQPEDKNTGIELSKSPEDSPDLTEEGRAISRLIASPPESNICYADLVRVSMDKQGMTQIQLGINDPYERDLGIITNVFYLSPRGTGVLLRLLIDNYKKFIKSSPELAKELSMPQLLDLIDDD